MLRSQKTLYVFQWVQSRGTSRRPTVLSPLHCSRGHDAETVSLIGPELALCDALHDLIQIVSECIVPPVLVCRDIGFTLSSDELAAVGRVESQIRRREARQSIFDSLCSDQRTIFGSMLQGCVATVSHPRAAMFVFSDYDFELEYRYAS